MVVVEEKKDLEVEEEKPLTLEEVKALAIKQACEKTFLNHALLCPHGNIDPRPMNLTATLFKRISAVSLESERGGEETTRFR